MKTTDILSYILVPATMITVLVSIASCANWQNSQSEVSTAKQDIPLGQVDSSSQDTNKYRSILLDNQLEVLLISSDDPQAAAVLDIRIGSASNPEEFPGLAHFLEHMLFLGTKKYPEPQSYQKFITANGGSYNGTTGPLHTNYYFTINTDKLDPALDRLSQLVGAPLFDRANTKREVGIIESEYQRYRNIESRELYGVEKESYNPKHPSSRFSVGNTETLLAYGEEALYQALLKFYQDNYSANRMKLVIQGKTSLDQLEALAKKHFSSIANGNKEKISFDQPIYSPDSLPMLLQIRPKSESYMVSYRFPISNFPDRFYNKSSQLVGHLLGHEAQGSLLDYLRSNNLATALSAGGFSIVDQRFISVRIGLTKEGREKIDKVHKALFAWIELIKQKGIEQWRYDELQRMAQINFDNQEETKPLDLALTMARTMHSVPTNRIFSALKLYSGFRRQEVSEIMNKLTPDNVSISLIAPDVFTDRKARWYNVDYSKSKFETKGLDHPEEIAGLNLPARNNFIPEQNSIEITPRSPYKIDLEGIITWHIPQKALSRASIHLGVFSQQHRTNAKVRALKKIYLRALHQRLASTSYMAQLSGLRSQIYDHLSGITLQVTGYSDKLPLYFNNLVTELSQWQLSNVEFTKYKKELLRDLSNSRNNPPSQRIRERIQAYLIKQISYTEDQKRIYQQLSYSDWQSFVNTIDDQPKELILLGYGEITKSQMQQSAKLARKLFLGPSIKLQPPQIRIIDPQPTRITENHTLGQSTEVLDLYIQAPHNDLRSQVLVLLLASYLHSPFFHELRTKKELGYLARVFPFNLLEQPGISFIVESDKVSSQQLVSYFQKFIDQQEQQIKQLDQQAFEVLNTGLINNLKIKPNSIAGKSSRYWQELSRNNTNFDSYDKMIAIAKTITIEDFKQAYLDLIYNNQRRLWTMIKNENSGTGTL